MKILITGAWGMVGKNIVAHSGMKDFSLLTPTRQEMNLFDYPATLSYIQSHKPDMIIHCAGKVGGIQANIKEPVAFLLNNVDINRNLIQASKEAQVKRLLNLGSSCMYPRNSLEALREEQVLTGELEPTNEGYALAKIMAQRLCVYINKEDPSYVYKTLIPCNIFGRFDHFDPQQSHLIPAIIKKLHDAKTQNLPTAEIWGDGTARREFMSATDLADCIFRCVTHFDKLPQLMNVGLGFDYSVTEYYQAAADVIGFKGTFTHDLSRPVGMQRKLVSVARQEQWGWKSKLSLVDGLRETYEYFLSIKGN